MGVLLARLADGRVLVEDVVRGQWPAAQRDSVILATAEVDRTRGLVSTWIEQAPGLAKEATDALIRKLAGHAVRPDRPSADKVSRADPWSAQAQTGNALLLAGAWVPAFLDEHLAFPAGRNDDQVDAASGALARLTGPLGADLVDAL